MKIIPTRRDDARGARMPSRRVDARSGDGPDGSRSETNETETNAKMRTPATLRRDASGCFVLNKDAKRRAIMGAFRRVARAMRWRRRARDHRTESSSSDDDDSDATLSTIGKKHPPTPPRRRHGSTTGMTTRATETSDESIDASFAPGESAELCAFIAELESDGTLERLERAAERLTRATTTTESDDGTRKTKTTASPLTDGTTTKNELLLAYLDATMKRNADARAALTPTNTLVRLDGTASSASALDASVSTPSTCSLARRTSTNTSRRLTYSNRESYDVDVARVVPTAVESPLDEEAATPKLTRSLAMPRRRRSKHVDFDTTSESPEDDLRTPPQNENEMIVPLHSARFSLEPLYNSSDTTNDDSPERNADDRASAEEALRSSRPSFQDVFPDDLRRVLLETLIDMSLDGNDGDVDTSDETDSDSWIPMLTFRLARLDRRVGPSRDLTVGLALLRCVDMTCQSLEGVLSRHSCAMLELERDVVERTHKIGELIRAVPSSRLRRATYDLHTMALDAIHRENLRRSFAMQRAHLDAVLGDPRLRRGAPETPADAFEYVAALSLEGRLSAL